METTNDDKPEPAGLYDHQAYFDEQVKPLLLKAEALCQQAGIPYLFAASPKRLQDDFKNDGKETRGITKLFGARLMHGRRFLPVCMEVADAAMENSPVSMLRLIHVLATMQQKSNTGAGKAPTNRAGSTAAG